MTARHEWQPSLDLELDDEGLPTFTVRELAEAINGALRRGFSEGVWVRGEIQGLNERNGHLYFALADDGEEGKATISVSFFANVRFKLRPVLQRHRLRLAEGMKVRIHGYPDFFAPSGRLSLKMSGIDPRYTLGELALQREDLVRRLVAEGIYDTQHRRSLPPLPLRIGIVTSVGSAAWHDVTDELTRSGFGFQVVACDVRVQGDTAAAMVAAGIRTLASRLPDAIVVVRGGGARADLAAFDAEVVVRAIAECPVPILTGLGHEVDRSVADEVAHLALKTPTACAGELIRRVRTFRDQAEATWSAIADGAGDRLDRHRRRLSERAQAASRQTRTTLVHAQTLLAGHHGRLGRDVRRVIATEASRLDRAGVRVQADGRHRVDTAAHRVDSVEARVEALDPARTLARGWSITRRADGGLVRSAGEVTAGDEITTTLADGAVRSRVEDTTAT